MVMPWFLPVAIGIAIFSTKTCIEYRRDPSNAKQRNGAWLMLFLGWLPLIAWLVNNIWPQY